MQWGVQPDATALQAYVDYEHQNRHPELTGCSVGFHTSCSHPFLGASPDCSVYDPSSVSEPYGFVEIKCPYSHRGKTPKQSVRALTFVVH